MNAVNQISRTVLFRSLLFGCIWLFLGVNVSAYALELKGLHEPQSVLIDAKGDYLFVANANGDLNAKDANGYITKADISGSVVVLKFIQSTDTNELSSPSGLAIIDNSLYVGDVDAVRIYNTASGAAEGVIDLSSYGMRINSLTADNSMRLYVSDAEHKKIYSINLAKDNEVGLLLDAKDLGAAGGLYFDKRTRRLFGVTQDTGKVFRLDAGGRVQLIKDNLDESLNGIFIDRKGDLYTASRTSGNIYRIANRGQGRIWARRSGLVGPADVAYDEPGRRILVPLSDRGKVVDIPLSHAEKR